MRLRRRLAGLFSKYPFQRGAAYKLVPNLPSLSAYLDHGQLTFNILVFHT
jgi:hypothetical protein